MAVTLGSTGITFPDATTQTTAPTGGGSIQATFTAAAAITAGQVVQYTTGTNVGPISGTVYTQAVTGGAPTATTPAAASSNSQIGVAFDPNTAGSFISFTYTDNSAITLAAGTLSGNTTTMGSILSVPVGANPANAFYQAKIMFDPVTAGKCMLIAFDVAASNAVKAWIFTVSGTTITLQSTTTLTSGTPGGAPVAWSYYGQDVFVYATVNSGGTTQAYACSISTYTITQGTATSLGSLAKDGGGTPQSVDMDYNRLTANRLVLAFVSRINNYPSAIVFDVTPATKVITAGSAVNIISVVSTGVSVAWDLLVSTRFALASFNTAGNTLSLNGGITSGTTITTAAQWHNFTGGYQTGPYAVRVAFSTTGSGSANSSVVGFYASAQQVCSARRPFFNSTALTGSGTPTVSWGTYIDVGGSISAPTTESQKIGGITQVPNQIGKFPLMRIGTSGHPWLYLGQAGYANTNLDSTKIVGIANASASASASVLVNLFGGVSTNQSGLTPNSNYYVDQTGVLTTSSTSPNVSIGKALSATSIVLKTLTI